MSDEQAKTIGRPTEFNPERARGICALIAEGKSIASIEAIEGMPSKTSILRWLSKEGPDYDAFRAEYARAREFRADARFERLDELTAKVESGELAPDKARVIIDTIKWQAGKERPKAYGDAVTVKGDKDNPLHVTKAVELSDADLLALANGGLRGVD